MKKSNVLKFIEQLKQDCKSNKIGLFLYNQKFLIDDGDKFGGWFCPLKKELHCSFPNKLQTKYVELLVHESCHMDQFINQTPKWVKEQNNDSLSIFWEWLKNPTKININQHLLNVQLMEAECEQLSIQKIIDLDLGINIQQYIQKANSYLVFYTVLKETKKWCDYPPYKFKEIWLQMPSDKILQKFSISKELKALYKAKCYKKKNS
ncbi:MAG: hypothetical protein K1X33_08675 [Methanobacteriaceae archaeon]|nr:hypothetical protein [Methanobacteriaceae archaeon]